MAKLEHTLNGGFNQWLNRIEDGILNGSMSASLEDSSDFRSGDARCSVRVFERYSYAGGNRVSLSVTLFQNGDGPISFKWSVLLCIRVWRFLFSCRRAVLCFESSRSEQR